MPVLVKDAPVVIEKTVEATIRDTNDVAFDLATILVLAPNPISAFQESFFNWGIQATPTGISVELLAEELLGEIEDYAKTSNFTATPLEVSLGSLKKVLNAHFGAIICTQITDDLFLTCPNCEVETMKVIEAEPIDGLEQNFGECYLCNFFTEVIWN